jgi:hypothetical protein
MACAEAGLPLVTEEAGPNLVSDARRVVRHDVGAVEKPETDRTARRFPEQAASSAIKTQAVAASGYRAHLAGFLNQRR